MNIVWVVSAPSTRKVDLFHQLERSPGWWVPGPSTLKALQRELYARAPSLIYVGLRHYDILHPDDIKDLAGTFPTLTFVVSVPLGRFIQEHKS